VPITVPEISVSEIEEMILSNENFYKKLEEKRAKRVKDEL